MRSAASLCFTLMAWHGSCHGCSRPVFPDSQAAPHQMLCCAVPPPAPCRQLGGFINGQRSTMDAPRAFFGVLHAFAAELDAAHEENSAADAAAADKGGSGRKVRGASAGWLPLGGSCCAAWPASSAAQGGGISCVICCWPPSTSPACRMASSAAGASLAARPAALPAGSSRGAGGTAPRRPAAWPRGRSQR